MNASNSSVDQQRARNSAYKLLEFRNRSEKELRDKLKEKKFSCQIIDETITYLKKYDLIDDNLFTKQWIHFRLNKPFGIHRIRFELKMKGIKESIIKKHLDEAMQEYQELEVVQELAQKRAKKYKGIEEQKIRQRVYGYLSRRGFSSNSISKALKEL